MKVDWQSLITQLDYHNKQWYERDAAAWLIINKARAASVISGIAPGQDPRRIMRMFAYRDNESSSRVQSRTQQQLAFNLE